MKEEKIEKVEVEKVEVEEEKLEISNNSTPEKKIIDIFGLKHIKYNKWGDRIYPFGKIKLSLNISQAPELAFAFKSQNVDQFVATLNGTATIEEGVREGLRQLSRQLP